MYPILRKALFYLDAERAHDLGVNALGLTGRSERLQQALFGKALDGDQNRPVQTLGLEFANALGVAAGLDKQGKALDGLFALGFGWVETGTVTPRPQAGNPRPRLFRLHQHQALINRMGFNSIGVERFTANLRKQQSVINKSGIVSINIGKNAQTPIERAATDYLTCLEAVFAYADIVTINVSSPNTPQLRDLQFGNGLTALLGAVSNRREQLCSEAGRRLPLLIKIAPDGMSESVLQDIVERSVDSGIDGIIATNTSTARPLVEHEPLARQAGGLSGKPIEASANATLALLSEINQGRLTLVGCGGIHDTDSAKRRLHAGADLLQLYTAFIYQGPELVQQIVSGIAHQT